MSNPIYPDKVDDKCIFCRSSRVNFWPILAHNGVVKSQAARCLQCGGNWNFDLTRSAVVMYDARSPREQTFVIGTPLQNFPDGKVPGIHVAMVPREGYLDIVAVGHGDYDEENGYGAVIRLEQFSGELRSTAFPDITDDQVNVVTEFSGARHEKEDKSQTPDMTHVVRLFSPRGRVISEHLCESNDTAFEYIKHELIVPFKHRVEVVDRITGKTGYCFDAS